MFARSILLPTLVACLVASPFLFSSAKHSSDTEGPSESVSDTLNGSQGISAVYLPGAQFSDTNSAHSFRQTGSSTHFQNTPIEKGAFQADNGIGLLTINSAIPLKPSATAALGDSRLIHPQIGSNTPIPGNAWNRIWPRTSGETENPGLSPNDGAAQTIVFPGNAKAPNLSVPHREFVPVMNFEEVFRFDIEPAWIKGRWNRVSTSPGSNGLHGFRVALVTGTHSSDLHGSLTYFFDQNQRAQRITFRGWTGDASKLIQVLTQKFDFKAQPTHWAGFYLAKNWGEPMGGFLMQNPTVIYSDNPVQQLALVLEINHTQGKSSLSEEFRSLIEGSRNAR